MKQRELKYKIQNQPASFSIQSNLFVFLSIINNIQPTKPNTTSSAAGVATAAAAETAEATAAVTTAAATTAAGVAAAGAAAAGAVWMTSGLR